MYSNLYKKKNKIIEAFESATISVFAALIVEFSFFLINNELIKNITNEEKEKLQIEDYIAALVIGFSNGFISQYLPREAFIIAASIIAVIINNFINETFNKEENNTSIIEEIFLTIISIYIVIFILSKLFEDSNMNRSKFTNSLITNILIYIAISIDFNIYNQFITSNISSNNELDIPVVFE